MPVSTPTFSSPTATFSINEGVTSVGSSLATDLDPGATLTYSIVGGADKAKFKIDAATGAITFVTAPDFEAPTDTTLNGTNTYQLIIQVADGPSGAGDTLTSTQTITVNVLNVNAVTLTGTAGDDLTLGVGTSTVENDTLNGLAGNDVLNGGVGADIMNGGLGNDTFIVDNVGDQANENSGEGTDTVQASVSYTITNVNVENLTLTGTAAINATGNASANTLTGNSGANILDGLAGADTMIGGAGNDVYRVDNALDVVTELDGGGTDRVESAITYTLGSFVENLTLTGSSAINGTGNSLNNTILGNAAVNTLTGGGGNDTLNGGAGADTMVGGTGADTYVVDNVGDIVTETAGQGIDVVQSSVTYTLSTEVENLTLTGLGAINGTGNTLNNTITGNAGVNILTGLAGDDKLDGKGGADTMVGGLGNDTYTVDNAGDVVTENASEGTDTLFTSVSGLTLAANVENMTLTSTAAIATGNTLDNVMTGNTAANTLNGGAGNDTLNGMSGADTMVGGLGNDTYYIDNAGDVVTENASEGTDKVFSSITVGALASNVENVELTGLNVINATGNTLDNVMTGNAKDNILNGLAGNDTLDGGRGYDTLAGGLGNDTYYVNDVNTVSLVSNTPDNIVENSGEGTDTVYSSINITAGYTLAANVENLVLRSGFGNINGNGNTLANTITGNEGWNVIDGGAGNDTISAGAGADTIIGGAGLDTLTGGADVDTFVFKAVTESGSTALTADVITDFQIGDIIDLSAIDARSDLAGDQAFVLDTNGVLAQGEILMTRSGNVITLSIDTDAVAGANMVLQITVDGSIPSGVLTGDNFVL